MAATLQQYSTPFLMHALYTNPSAQSFPWENGFTRTQVIAELANRSGEADSTQIVSANPVMASATKTMVTSVKGKSDLK